ncbi:DUF3833 domain-containing protein [Marinomonas spartinae]|uniref:DUF3833 domain-containing protein n=1 Tax=Marinomonas spartinae TaxID=1792290 RepID=UPI0018F11648|nr:DUF3833 domain-containing protein [Marinomonas spartinae]MBJ7554603.1 DUF3833 domain-containing protein [Marinomonas spartinae]
MVQVIARTLINKKWRVCFWLLALGMLNACSSPNVALYAKNKPEFKLQQFFNGPLTAHGIVKNRSGEVIRYFNADLVGSWNNGVGTLKEHFLFNDGEKQQRTWTLTPTKNGKYESSAGDVVGKGSLNMAGNALFMKYVLQVPYDGDVINVNVDDRMYMVNPNVVINESVLSKFGFDVGYLTLVIEKRASPES